MHARSFVVVRAILILPFVLGSCTSDETASGNTAGHEGQDGASGAPDGSQDQTPPDASPDIFTEAPVEAADDAMTCPTRAGTLQCTLDRAKAFNTLLAADRKALCDCMASLDNGYGSYQCACPGGPMAYGMLDQADCLTRLDETLQAECTLSVDVVLKCFEITANNRCDPSAMSTDEACAGLDSCVPET